MSFVDDNQTEIFNGSKKGGTRADDDLGSFFEKEIFPDLVAFGFGLF